MSIDWLDPYSIEFPSPDKALTNPDGLLAAGGDLQPERLIEAYRNGIFPWFSHQEPILWWSPNPRCVLDPNAFKISKSFRKTLKKNLFQVRINQEFETVIRCCAMDRGDNCGTWINEDMIAAYCQLNQLGIAHSVESWYNGQLVGGLYGLSIGGIFCGESMFSKMSEASKVAFYYLSQHLLKKHFALIDCQLPTPHLLSLGAKTISRNEFLSVLKQVRDEKRSFNTPTISLS